MGRMTPSCNHPLVSSHSIPGVRGTLKNYQHDRVLTSHTVRGTVLAVFDGHGLVQTGHLVSALCADRFMPILEQQPAWRAPVVRQRDERVIKALRNVVDELEKEADALTERVKLFSGCTLCAVILRGGWLYSINVGDSRAVLGFTKGRGLEAVQLTRDHVANDPAERKRIERNGGWVANNRLNGDLEMSRTIGDTEFKKYRNQRRFNRTGQPFGPELLVATPDIEARRIAPGDVMTVVATDGVWVPGLSNEAVMLGAGGWAKARGVEEAAMNVVSMALEWGSKDNISVIVCVFSEIPELARRSRFRDFRERRRLGRRHVDKDPTVHGEHRFEDLAEDVEDEDLQSNL